MILEDSTFPPNNALLLEDDPKDRLSIRLHLELMGFVVYDTPSPLEAKEIFEQHDFSLVLLHLGHAPTSFSRDLSMGSLNFNRSYPLPYRSRRSG